jgi:prephenate dehydrogenase
MNLALVGCGLVGGSFALALRRAGAISSALGHDADGAAAERAVARGIVERAASLEAAVAAADVVVVAVPVRAIPSVLARIAAAAREGTIVTDVGSTKAAVVRAGDAETRVRFVGGHPLAGTERSGPDAADAALFQGRRVLLTPTARTDAAARETVAALWRAAGASVGELDAEEHDRRLAAVSHLPHVVAYALAGALESSVAELAGLAGGGFTDTTRIASTPPARWLDVFVENRDAVLAWLDAYAAELAAWREAIAAADVPRMSARIAAARAARAGILGGR